MNSNHSSHRYYVVGKAVAVWRTAARPYGQDAIEERVLVEIEQEIESWSPESARERVQRSLQERLSDFRVAQRMLERMKICADNLDSAPLIEVDDLLVMEPHDLDHLALQRAKHEQEVNALGTELAPSLFDLSKYTMGPHLAR